MRQNRITDILHLFPLYYVCACGLFVCRRCVQVPADSEYPADRVSYILEDCKAPVLVTHSELIASHPDFVLPPGCQMIQYDKVDDLLEEQDDTCPTRDETGQTNRDVCYVIYTSGSTGRPKGSVPAFLEIRTTTQRFEW